MRLPDRVVTGILLASAFGCAEQQAARAVPTVDTTAAGIVRVLNGPGSWSRADTWRATRKRSVGEPDGLLLTNPLVGVSVGPDGRTCVLDMPAQELSCMGSVTDSLQVIAGPGPGPGELSFAGCMGWGPKGRLWVSSGRGAYSVYDPVKGFIETHPRPSTGLMRRVCPLRFDERGRVIEEAIGSGGVAFTRYDPADGSADMLATLIFPGRNGGRGGPIFRDRATINYVLNNYRTRLHWAVTSHSQVWFTRSDQLTLYLVDLATGDTLREVRTTHRRPREIARKEEAVIDRGLKSLGVDRGDMDLARPIVQSMHVDPAGNVWVQIIDEVGQAGRQYDVFDPSGIFLGTVDLGYGLPRNAQPALTEDVFVGIALGRHDVPSIVWSEIEKPDRFDSGGQAAGGDRR